MTYEMFLINTVSRVRFVDSSRSTPARRFFFIDKYISQAVQTAARASVNGKNTCFSVEFTKHLHASLIDPFSRDRFAELKKF